MVRARSALPSSHDAPCGFRLILHLPPPPHLGGVTRPLKTPPPVSARHRGRGSRCAAAHRPLRAGARKQRRVKFGDLSRVSSCFAGHALSSKHAYYSLFFLVLHPLLIYSASCNHSKGAGVGRARRGGYGEFIKNSGGRGRYSSARNGRNGHNARA
ncbi:hypothetical protein B484DRAFT_169863 [Ochromonadaceae sp. CCMP2298]|nr:hypothetical protein B484DRAFT_169863 [Ochromonadaceae sp. CCMP2298]